MTPLLFEDDELRRLQGEIERQMEGLRQYVESLTAVRCPGGLAALYRPPTLPPCRPLPWDDLDSCTTCGGHREPAGLGESW